MAAWNILSDNENLRKLMDYYRDEYEKDNRPLSDEEVLERMDIKTIENFLRKKKLERIKK